MVLSALHLLVVCRHVDLIQDGIRSGDQLTRFLHDLIEKIQWNEGNEEHQGEGERCDDEVHLHDHLFVQMSVLVILKEFFHHGTPKDHEENGHQQ